MAFKRILEEGTIEKSFLHELKTFFSVPENYD
jgi:hypothetical protein